MTADVLRQIYELLYERFGPQGWWPGDGRDEIIVGAILTQNTNWQNVEKAIKRLKDAGCMNLKRLYELEVGTLAELIRPAGYYNIKAGRLKNFLSWLFTEHDGDIDVLEQLDTQSLREQLLRVRGIGRETADSILLYAFGRAVFVVDAYTFRVVHRHRLVEADCDYEQLRQLFEDNLEADAAMFNEYHALLVRVGKEFCRPKARCAGCPLEKLAHDVR